MMFIGRVVSYMYIQGGINAQIILGYILSPQETAPPQEKM